MTGNWKDCPDSVYVDPEGLANPPEWDILQIADTRLESFFTRFIEYLESWRRPPASN